MSLIVFLLSIGALLFLLGKEAEKRNPGTVLSVLIIFCIIFLGGGLIIFLLYEINQFLFGISETLSWVFIWLLIIGTVVVISSMLYDRYKKRWGPEVLYNKYLEKYSTIEPSDEEIEEFILGPAFALEDEMYMKEEERVRKFLTPGSIFYYKTNRLERKRIVESWRSYKAYALAGSMSGGVLDEEDEDVVEDEYDDSEEDKYECDDDSYSGHEDENS